MFTDTTRADSRKRRIRFKNHRVKELIESFSADEDESIYDADDTLVSQNSEPKQI